MSWKQPQRPPVKISQCYNDGMARVFSVSDAAVPGYQPIGELTPKIALPYEERRVGIKRYYDAQQNQIRVERVIRVQHVGGITSQDVVLDEKGRIDPEKLDALQFDQFKNGYYLTGEKAGKAWNAGVPLMKE